MNASSVDVAKARIGAWTETKTLSWTGRDYSTDYDGSLHTTNNWDNSGTDVFVCPMLKITAIVLGRDMHEYKCTMLRVVDGDTVDVDIDLGFGIWMRKQRIRMYGIDTPESRTRDLEEKKYGPAAKDFLVKWTNAGGLVLKTHKDNKGKFGRILGELWYGEVNINEKMIEEHHAVRYMGQSKEDIAEEHIKNRAFVNL